MEPSMEESSVWAQYEYINYLFGSQRLKQNTQIKWIFQKWLMTLTLDSSPDRSTFRMFITNRKSIKRSIFIYYRQEGELMLLQHQSLDIRCRHVVQYNQRVNLLGLLFRKFYVWNLKNNLSKWKTSPILTRNNGCARAVWNDLVLLHPRFSPDTASCKYSPQMKCHCI